MIKWIRTSRLAINNSLSLQDVVIGKIYFLLVRLKIKHMEIEIRKRESTGSGSDLYNESETITKFEVRTL
jgi:vacuolar protein sorting-associated protein 26